MAFGPKVLASLLRRRPRPVARLTPRAIARTFHQAMFQMGEGKLGDIRLEVDLVETSERALYEIHRDFREGQAQTPQERALGAALDHVVRKHLEA